MSDTDWKVGDKVLITKGDAAGRLATIIYVYYRHNEGFCQAESIIGPGWKKVYWIVPYYDHCGEPTLFELREGSFTKLPH